MFKRPKMSALVYRPAWIIDPRIANWIRGRFGGLMLILMTASASAQSASGTFDDHQNMMDQLGIKKMRPGPDPNNQSTFDEATANPYTNSLPDVLTMKDGTKVTRPDQWPARRAEIQEDFEREVYGRIPANVPKVTWEVTATTHGTNGGIPTVTKTLVGHVDNSAYTNITVNIQASFTVPAQRDCARADHDRVWFRRLWRFWRLRAALAVAAMACLALEQAITNGWGYGTINPDSIQPDNNQLTSGIIGLANKGQPRKPDDWGALRAWQWGVSRLIDYFEANPDSMVDAKKVGIEGLSRYGKAAIVTEAFEPRIAVGLIGSSGEGGVKLHRHIYGEAVENLAGGEYYWMAGNFIKYGAVRAVEDRRRFARGFARTHRDVRAAPVLHQLRRRRTRRCQMGGCAWQFHGRRAGRAGLPAAGQKGFRHARRLSHRSHAAGQTTHRRRTGLATARRRPRRDAQLAGFLSNGWPPTSKRRLFRQCHRRQQLNRPPNNFYKVEIF